MKLLVLCESPSLADELCVLLVPWGFLGVSATTRQEAEAILKDESPRGAIVDVDPGPHAGLELLTALHTGQRPTVPCVALCGQADKNRIAELIALGIVACVLKPLQEQRSQVRLQEALKPLAEHHTQRQHLRITPSDDDLARITFRIPGYDHLVSGRIKDLSVGGLAAVIHNPPQERYLRTGLRLTRIQISVGSSQLAPAATITSRDAAGVSLRFEAMSPRDRGALARFIFRKLSDL